MQPVAHAVTHENMTVKSYKKTLRLHRGSKLKLRYCIPQTFVLLQIWARRRNISSHQDPLDHIFSEFDEDHDGYLRADDVTAALGSRNVDITPKQAQMFLEGELTFKNCLTSNGHWLHLGCVTASDLYHK